MNAVPCARCLSRSVDGPQEAGADGTIGLAVLAIGSTRWRILELPDLPDFAPSAAVSIRLACDTTAKVVRITVSMADQGTVMMPVDSYPFAERFAWVADRFGIQWRVICAGGAPHPGTRPGGSAHPPFRTICACRSRRTV